MPEANDEKVSKGRATLSVEGRKILGESILNGIIGPGEVIAGSLDYNQSGGNYVQRGGGNYHQGGGGNYDQAPLR
ncbi:hypothetical protein [Nonomuraea guangzhouensis]|uniref:Uncharacterized protein n=1 Tax=Nonomuraea guangzhouensis TaxID=1291555 RepID=A0ABW4GUY9_9ACTN|nr:hypothetical protein [Nonomuraea guangzhouensis]